MYELNNLWDFIVKSTSSSGRSFLVCLVILALLEPLNINILSTFFKYAAIYYAIAFIVTLGIDHLKSRSPYER